MTHSFIVIPEPSSCLSLIAYIESPNNISQDKGISVKFPKKGKTVTLTMPLGEKYLFTITDLDQAPRSFMLQELQWIHLRG